MIILIGFKNVGKSSIGLALARHMQSSFMDLDEAIEEVYAQTLLSSAVGENLDHCHPRPKAGDPGKLDWKLDPRLRPSGLVEDDNTLNPTPSVEDGNVSSGRLSCREIAGTYGEAYFRALEKSTFAQTLLKKPAILSVGGGTVMDGDNQVFLKGHVVIHITAPYDLVYERIMSQGMPSFFPADEPARISFNRLWQERHAVYNRLAHVSIENDGTIESAVQKILKHNIVSALGTAQEVIGN